MTLSSQRNLTLICAATTVLGCSSTLVQTPYTNAASAYGSAANKGAQTLAALPTLVSSSCWKSSNTAYLQSRLERLNADVKGVTLPTTTTAYITFNDWRDQAQALPGHSWNSYCNETNATSKAFTSGIAALTRYANSLQTLVKAGVYDGSGLQNLTTSIGKVRDSVVNNGSDSSTTIGPIADVVGKLSSMIEARVVEADLGRYVAESDPKVAALIDALVKYLSALDGEFKILQSQTEMTLVSLELSSGLGTERDPLPGCAKVRIPSAPHALVNSKNAALPEAGGHKKGSEGSKPLGRTASSLHVEFAVPRETQLEDICDTLAFLTRRIDSTIVLSLYQYVLSAADDVRSTRTILNDVLDILGKLKSAHNALRSANNRASQAELKSLVGGLMDLENQIQALQSAVQAKI